jgi:RNA polymerase sigma-70 factor (ECF subfamily)
VTQPINVPDGDNSDGENSDRTNSDRTGAAQRDAFARLFAKHDRWLFSYLVTLLANSAHAEEVFQEVCVILWREHEKFQLGTNFVKWVSVIAHHQVQKFRRERNRMGPQLSDQAVERLATTAAERADLFDFRRDALRRCMGKLSDDDRQLIQTCYADSNATFKATALQMGRPINTVYKALNRIRHLLHQCIEHKLSAERML